MENLFQYLFYLLIASALIKGLIDLYRAIKDGSGTGDYSLHISDRDNITTTVDKQSFRQMSELLINHMYDNSYLIAIDRGNDISIGIKKERDGIEYRNTKAMYYEKVINDELKKGSTIKILCTSGAKMYLKIYKTK